MSIRPIVAVLVGLPLAGRAVGQELRAAQLTLDLGFVNVSGNTRVTSFNLGEKLGYTAGLWTFAQTVSVIYGETDGSSTAEAYAAGVRGDYRLGKWLSAFGLGTWDRNIFAGVAERFAEGAGLAVRAVQRARDSLSFEGALSMNQERNTAGATSNFAASRAAVAFRHGFGTAAFFTQDLELLSNLKSSADQRVNSLTAITAPISRQIALKATYMIRYDHQPEPGFRDTDRIFTTGIQIAF